MSHQIYRQTSSEEEEKKKESQKLKLEAAYERINTPNNIHGTLGKFEERIAMQERQMTQPILSRGPLRRKQIQEWKVS